MNCNNCGTYNNPGTTNCQRCGAPLTNNVPNNQMNMQPMMQPQQPQYQQQVQQPMMQPQQPMMQPQQPIQQQMNMQQGNNVHKPFNKKLLTISLALVIIIVLIIIFSKFLKGSSIVGNSKELEGIDAKTLEQVYDSKDPLIFEKNGKKGFMDYNGKVIVPAEYDNVARDFSYGFGIASNNNNEYFLFDKKGNLVAKTQGYWAYRDYSEKNKVIRFGSYIYNFDLKKLNDDKKVNGFSNGYAVLKNDNKYELMNPKGKIVYTNDKSFEIKKEENDSIFDDVMKENYCVLRFSNSDYKLLNCDTGKIIKESKDAIIIEKNNIVRFLDDYKKYFIKNNKLEYGLDSNGFIFYKDDYLEIREKSGEQSYYIDIHDFKKYPERINLKTYSKLHDNVGYEQKQCTAKDGTVKYQIVKGSKKVLNCEWDSFSNLDSKIEDYLISKGKYYIYGKKDGKYHLIDIGKNKILFSFNAWYVNNTETAFGSYVDDEKDKRIVYNIINGKKIELNKDYNISYYKREVMVEHDGKVDYYNKDLKLIHTEKK